MRINLVTPFAEKDAAKGLGARWDATRKIWYITDVADLTPFLRWIPDMAAATAQAAGAPASPASGAARPAARRSEAAVNTRSVVAVPHCGCEVLPWEDCVHSAKA